MTVLPGSLDYLYYNGILDHIPYEAYEMTPNMATYQNMNGSQYLDMAQQGARYSNYNTNDSFVRSRNNYEQGQDFSMKKNAFDIDDNVGKDVDFETRAFSKEQKDIRQGITNTAGKVVDSFASSPAIVKGIVGLGVVAGTLYMLLKGRKSAGSDVVENEGKKWFQKLMFWRHKG